MTRWLVVAVLLIFAAWTANATLANWWAAGGPPNVNAQQSEPRGNIFAVVTLVLFSAAVATALLKRKRPPAQRDSPVPHS